MLKRLLPLAVFALVIWGGAKAWVYFQTQQWLAAVQETYALQGALDHGWIGSSLIDGEVIIHDLEIRPFRLKDTLSAEKARFRFGNRLALLSLPVSSNAGSGLPSRIRVELEGLQLPLSRNWQSILSLPEALIELTHAPCGPLQTSSVEGFEQLGYDSLQGSADLRWRPMGDADEGYRIRLDLQLEELAEIGLGVSLSRLPFSPDSAPEAATDRQPPAFYGAELALEDRGLQERIAVLCAPEQGLARSAYPAAFLRQWQNRAADLGMTFSPGILRAFGQYFAGGHSLNLSVKPGQDFDYALMAMVPAESVSQQLPLSLKLDNQGVLDTYYEIEFGKLLNKLYPPEPVAPPEEEPEPAPKALPRQYEDFPLEELDTLGQLPVRVEHRNGKVTTGILDSVSAGSIDVSVPMASGDVVFHIRRRDIVSLQVYR